MDWSNAHGGGGSGRARTGGRVDGPGTHGRQGGRVGHARVDGWIGGAVTPNQLRDFATEVLRRVQVPEADAALIARYLVEVDLRGVMTHGTRQLRRYVVEFRGGRINPQAEIAQVMDAPAIAVFDGDGGAGYLVATRATEAVIEKAKATGVAVGCTRNHGHVGSAGIYARLALASDLATFCVAGGVAWKNPRDPMQPCGMRCARPRCVLAFQQRKTHPLCWI